MRGETGDIKQGKALKSSLSPPPHVGSHAFENACSAHAGADAHRHHAVLAARATQTVHHGRGADGTGGAQGVTQGDGAAPGVHPRIVVVQAQPAQHRQALGGKSLVNFEAVNGIEPQAYIADVIEKIDLGRPDAGALRLRLVGVKNCDPATEEQPFRVTGDNGRERYHENVVLDLDYTVLIPKAR